MSDALWICPDCGRRNEYQPICVICGRDRIPERLGFILFLLFLPVFLFLVMLVWASLVQEVLYLPTCGVSGSMDDQFFWGLPITFLAAGIAAVAAFQSTPRRGAFAWAIGIAAALAVFLISFSAYSVLIWLTHCWQGPFL